MGWIWVALVAGAALSGAALVGVLIARPVHETPLGLAGVASLGLSLYALARIALGYPSEATTVWAFGFILAAGAGGYALASTLLHLLARRPALPSLPYPLPPDRGTPAVLVVACTEPETYSPTATAGMLQGLAEDGLLDASIGLLPFLFFAQKTRYRAAGGRNPAFRQLDNLAEKLEPTVGGASVSAALCVGPDSLALRVAEAVRGGHRSVVVAQLTVGEPMAFAAAREAVDDLTASVPGIAVTLTGVLSCSERITGMLAERVMRTVSDRRTTGIVLLGHGQPDELSSRNPGMDEDETVFLSRLRVALTDRGLNPERVRIAWAEWGEPDVTTAVRHLAALGCDRVVVQPAAFPLDTIGTQLDLEVAIRQARIDQAASVVTLSAWRDDPAVIEELRARVSQALDRD